MKKSYFSFWLSMLLFSAFFASLSSAELKSRKTIDKDGNTVVEITGGQTEGAPESDHIEALAENSNCNNKINVQIFLKTAIGSANLV